MVRTVSVIGAGRIGGAVIAFLRATPGLRLGRVLSRRGAADTGDPAAFFSAPADLFIEAAGPEALHRFGPDAVARADLWTVGAAALAEDGFRAEMERAALRHGTRLALFSPWIAGIGQAPPGPASRLHVRAARPGLGAGWSGPLRDAVTRYPDDLNSAVAAALCGPGLDATTVTLTEAGPDGAHRIDAVLDTPSGRFTTAAEFPAPGRDLHPTAAALIGALERDLRPLGYG